MTQPVSWSDLLTSPHLLSRQGRAGRWGETFLSPELWSQSFTDHRFSFCQIDKLISVLSFFWDPKLGFDSIKIFVFRTDHCLNLSPIHSQFTSNISNYTELILKRPAPLPLKCLLSKDYRLMSLTAQIIKISHFKF